MVGKGAGIVGREGVRGGVTGSGWARLAAAVALGVVGVGAVGGLSACTSTASAKPAAQSTPLATSTTTSSNTTSSNTTSSTSTTSAAGTSAGTATTTAPAASTSASATAVPTRNATRATTVTTASRPATLDPALVGQWNVHDATLTIRADGTGTMSAHSCTAGPNGQQVCDLLSTVRVTPMGSGARLTVTSTRAYLSTGTPGQTAQLAPVPSWVDPAGLYAAVGDYSVLEPFTAATWPYTTPLTSADQRAVYSWRLAHRGGSLGDPKNVLARQCHDGLPVSAEVRTYCGA